VSSEEVPRGKPYPDVYLEAARQLGEPPATCAAIEDSANGIRSAVNAGLWVAAVPNPEFPPPIAVLAQADLVVDSLSDLTEEALGRLGDDPEPTLAGLVGDQEVESFPASNPHTDWARPPRDPR
jgi:beta-phosphoglucomutase-like phosphatase (HAD superfamily)